MMSDLEIEKLTDSIAKKIEPHIRQIVEDIFEDAFQAMFQHLAHELDVFAKMRKNREI